MQITDATYNTIKAGNHRVEYKAEIAGITYNQGDITINGAPVVSSGLFEKFGVGNAVAADLDIWIKPKGTIPTMARIDLYYRLANATTQSSWMPKGQFYIDTRKKNFAGLIHFQAFDAMLKAEYTFMESGTWTSTTALATVTMIASDMSVPIHADTVTLLTNDSKPVPIVPVIGEDGTTGREMLQAIAAIYGGNFIIDEEGKLKLVQLVAPADTIDIGDHAVELDQAPAFDAIDRVILYAGENKETGYRSPEAMFDQLTGRILEAYCPWTSQQLADDLLDIVDGYVYQPFVASGANIDPAMQLGDGIEVGGITSVIFNATLTLDARCAADLSAPYEEEINHEYPYRSPAQRVVDDAVTKEELATPGQTIINGSNIKTGTITLGGDNNGNGQLQILDENDVQCGEWNNGGIVIYDNSTPLGATTTDNKIRIVRQGDDPDVDEALKLGVSKYTLHPDFREPYIYLTGKLWDADTDDYIWAQTELTAKEFRMFYGTESCTIKAQPETTAISLQRLSGVTASASFRTWGRVAQLQLTLNGDGAWHAAGSNLFYGSINYMPKVEAMGAGYYDSAALIGRIETNGIITIRVCGTGLQFNSGGGAIITWTYLF